MKRIAIVHHIGELGGGTKSLVDVAVMLCDRYEIIICIPQGSFLEVQIEKKNISIHEMKSGVPYLNLFSGSSPLISKTSLASLKSLLKMKSFCQEIADINPDMVLFNSIVTSVSSLKLRGMRCAFIDRETMTNKMYIVLYNRIINSNIKGAAFLCNYEKRKFWLNNEIITSIIPDCVSEKDLVCMDDIKDVPDDDSYKVLFMGGSSVLKGAHTVLKAALKLDKDVTVLIAGKFDERIFSIKNILRHLYNPGFCRHLIILRRAYNIAAKLDNVLFLGLKTDIYPLILKSDMVIFPSSKVHQPRPCIEAGYFRKPVIISDFEETKEYFIQGYNALTFKPNSENALAQCIRYANENREEMGILGEHNYEMSMRYHNYKDIKNELIRFVEQIIE